MARGFLIPFHVSKEKTKNTGINFNHKGENKIQENIL